LGVGIVAIDNLGEFTFVVGVIGIKALDDELGVSMVTGEDDGLTQAIASLYLQPLLPSLTLAPCLQCQC
jgi:hypothetical protein